MKDFKIPCNIGEDIFVVENYNQYHDECSYFTTIYNSKIVIKKYNVEAFIIDDKGVSIAEDGHDGFNKMTTYHNLTLDEFGDCKIFFSEAEAVNFVTSVIKIVFEKEDVI